MNRKELKQFMWKNQHLDFQETQRAIQIRFKKRVSIPEIINIRIEFLGVKLKMLEDRLMHEIKSK